MSAIMGLKLTILAGLGLIAAPSACVHKAEAPPSEPPAQPTLAERLVFQAPAGTYFKEWPDIYEEPPSRESERGARPAEGGRDRFVPAYPASPPSGPESQRPLRMLQRPE